MINTSTLRMHGIATAMIGKGMHPSAADAVDEVTRQRDALMQALSDLKRTMICAWESPEFAEAHVLLKKIQRSTK